MTPADPNETAGFIGMPDGRSVYARHYAAEGPSEARPVVIVPADGEERTWSQRTMVNLARFLARAGHPVVRFDFRGQGESDGVFEQTDLASRAEDLAAIVERVREGSGTVPALVGLRLGAAIAARHAASPSGAGEPVVAIEPVISMPGYVGELLRKNLANQLVVHKKVTLNREQLVDRVRAGSPVSCNGFHLSRGFLDSLGELDWDAARRRCGRLSVLWIARPSGEGEEAVEDLPPFWVERPILSPYPAALFRAVEAKLDGARAQAPSGPLPLEPRGSGGSEIVAIPADPGPLVATWHPAADGGIPHVFLNPGPNDRSGPHGLYARLAARLAASGHPALRLDAWRIGESGGDDGFNQGRPVADYYREINEGAMVPGVLAAVDWLSLAGHREMVLVGLCGGAVNAALAAGERSDRIRRIVMLGTPVLHLGAGEDATLSDQAVRDEIAILRGKLVEPSSIVRFLTFRSDYRAIGRVLAARVRRLAGATRDPDRSVALETVHPQAIVGLFHALERYGAGGGRATLVFSEHDRLRELFRAHYPPLRRGEGLPAGAELEVLEGTNHNVTDRAAEERLLEILGVSRRAAAPEAVR